MATMPPSSSGSNLGPTSQKLIDAVKQRVTDYRTENGMAADALVPGDAVTASGSGLDPHISVKNALLQAPRVARERGPQQDAVKGEIDKGRQVASSGFSAKRVSMSSNSTWRSTRWPPKNKPLTCLRPTLPLVPPPMISSRSSAISKSGS